MPRKILIVQGHPDPAPERFCRALASAYAEGARAAGHEVEIIELANLKFPWLRSASEFQHGALPTELEPAAQALGQADHLVLIFPLWLGTMPALVKALLEQLMRPGVAFEYPQGKGLPKQLLAGKSARVVVTMGMPALLYRWWYRAHGVKGLVRNILKFVGFAPVNTVFFGLVEGASPQRHSKWLERMHGFGGQAR